MLENILSVARGLTLASVALRLFTAFLCGSVIGIDRELKRRSAGFRTHVLICLGAACAAATGQYLLVALGQNTDASRLGSQVISGIGFIGAGTIVATAQQKIRGLTTAAGLWAAAIVGLAAGAGYVELAIPGAALVLLAEDMLVRMERRLRGLSKSATAMVEYLEPRCMNNIIHEIRSRGYEMENLEVSRIDNKEDGHHYYAIITVVVNRQHQLEPLLEDIRETDKVVSVEEL